MSNQLTAPSATTFENRQPLPMRVLRQLHRPMVLRRPREPKHDRAEAPFVGFAVAAPLSLALWMTVAWGVWLILP